MSEATSGIASLISRIKQDGVQAGEAERQARVEAARAEAAEIIANAQKQAVAIAAAAEAEATKRRAQLDAELRMAARDFVFRFQERLSQQVITPQADAAAAATVADGAGVVALVLQVLGESTSGKVTIDPALRAKLVSALGAKISAAAGADGIEIVDEAGLGGFRLTRKGEHFVWDVSREAIARELARLVEPSLRGALSLSAE